MPEGSKTVARRFTRNLVVAAREGAPPEILVEWLIAIMEGHGQAKWARDERCACGFRVTWPETGEMTSTPEQMQWAWTQLRQAGYGLPVQQIALEGELRTFNAQLAGVLDLGALPPRAVHAIRDVFRNALAAPREVGAPVLEASSPHVAGDSHPGSPARIIDVDPGAPASTDHPSAPGAPASTDHAPE